MSTDKQSADSPADQIARCREFAKARGFEVVETCVVTEAGVSGASRHNRPGLLSLFARIAEWDALLCWDSARLGRNAEDLGWVRNKLSVAKKTGYEVATGLDLFNVGSKVMSVFAEEYLVKLRADTQRGLRGRAGRGLSTGGTPYGYRTEPVALDEQGRPVEGAGFRDITYERDRAGRILGHSGLHSRATRARHPLSGLLECGACGGAFFAVTGRGHLRGQLAPGPRAGGVQERAARAARGAGGADLRPAPYGCRRTEFSCHGRPNEKRTTPCQAAAPAPPRPTDSLPRR
jgi:DNA invertase Pin-like site-specific DNA recombinase